MEPRGRWAAALGGAPLEAQFRAVNVEDEAGEHEPDADHLQRRERLVEKQRAAREPDIGISSANGETTLVG